MGLRGRTLNQEEAERYGKYRPIKIGKQLYNHPLGMNLYNLNNSQEHIAAVGKALVFESEKSCLLYQSYFGLDNDISVACCGSSITAFQIQQLLDLGVREIVIAFDRQFKAIGDDEFKRLKAKLIHIHKKYGHFVRITAIFDKDKMLPYKASPIDKGTEIFERITERQVACRDHAQP